MNHDTHKPCPECARRILSDSTSCRCGWKAAELAKAEASGTRCAHVDPITGQQCERTGVVSIAGGPWKCREHSGSIAVAASNTKSLAAREWHEKMERYLEAHPDHRMPRMGDA